MSWTATRPPSSFAPHFYGLDAGGLAAAAHFRAFTSIFPPIPTRSLDAWFMAGRQRFGDVRMLNRADGVNPSFPTCARGLAVPVARHGFRSRESIFVPFTVFHGHGAVLSRFARLGRAKGDWHVHAPDAQGYVAELIACLDHYPTDDRGRHRPHEPRAGGWIATMPGQYYWVHKRFKTRPEDSLPCTNNRVEGRSRAWCLMKKALQGLLAKR